jgi:hypothetical protein
MTSVFARRGLVFVTLALLVRPACPLRANEVYKSIDAQGHVVYSDRADTSTAQKSVVRVDRPDPTEVERIAKEQEILKAEEIQRNRQKSVDDAKKIQQDHLAQVQCDNARHPHSVRRNRRSCGNPHHSHAVDGVLELTAVAETEARSCGGRER